jgi:hypothetical protein
MRLACIIPIVWIMGWLLMWVPASRSAAASHPAAAAAWLALLFGASGFLVGLYLFGQGFRVLRREQFIANTPLSKIAAAAMGPVEIYGTVTGPYTLLSPLAETECYYYRTVAWSEQDSQGHPAERVAESLYAPFYVEDDTGRVMIDPRGAGIELPAAYEEQIAGEGINECARRFLSRHGLSTYGISNLREYAIKPGDSLFVVGHLRENNGWTDMPDAKPGDLPRVGEGFLSPAAADLQRREMLEAMGISQIDLPAPNVSVPPGFDLHPRVLVGRGGNAEPFLLAHNRPERLIGTLARRATVWIWGGPVLALLSLGLLLRGLHLW